MGSEASWKGEDSHVSSSVRLCRLNCTIICPRSVQRSVSLRNLEHALVMQVAVRVLTGRRGIEFISEAGSSIVLVDDSGRVCPVAVIVVIGIKQHCHSRQNDLALAAQR